MIEYSEYQNLLTEIANLRSALVAEGHTADCPVVLGGSVDCVPGGGCTANTTKEVYPALFEVACQRCGATGGLLD